MKKGPDPHEENLRLLGEQLTDTPSHPTRSPEEWETHERNGHLPKLPDCPVCVEEQGPVVRHYAQSSPSLNTLHLDTGYWGDWSLDEERYFIAAALRVEHDKSGILIPFFVPVENKSAIVVSSWSYAMRFAAEMLRHKALGFTWNMPAFGKEVGLWRSQDKKLIKSANNRGAIGRLIEVTPWQNGTTSLIAKGSDLQEPEIIQGLQTKTNAVECLRLSEPRTIPEGWTRSALDVFARDWTSIVTPEGKDLWIQLKTGKAQYSSPFLSEFADAKTTDSFAYWGDVNEAGNDQVRQEVLDFVCPTH